MSLFEYPLVLLILPVLVIGWMRFRAHREAIVSSLHIGSGVSIRERILADTPRFMVLFSALIAVVIIANPIEGEEHIYKEKLSQRFAVVIDKSSSMAANKKIETAKKSTIDLMNRRPKDLFALVPFSETALLAEGSPFTTDRDYVEKMVRAVQANGGATGIGNGIVGGVWYLLREVYVTNDLKKSGIKLPTFSKLVMSLSDMSNPKSAAYLDRLTRDFGVFEGSAIILVTDGDNNAGVSPDEAIRFAANFKVPVYVISIPDDPTKAPLFASALTENGGAYFLVTDPAQISAMYRKIEELQPVLTRAQTVIVQKSHRQELGLLCAVLLLVALIVRAYSRVIE